MRSCRASHVSARPLNCGVSRLSESAVQFYVMARTYNTYGGDPTLALISDFLLGEAADFGPALSELTVTFHFPHAGPPRRTLEQSFADFHEYRRSLPKVAFKRKRSQASIDVASELVDGKEWEGRRGLSLPLFKAGVVETIGALQLLRTRLTPKDDFGLEAFLAHCTEAQMRLPSTAEELAAFAEDSKRRRAVRNAAMSPWERLGIDWRDFHPDARRILDEPFYWECANDFAPHGNDTGADLLEDFRNWHRRNPSGDPLTFYRGLIRGWGFPSEPVSDLERTVFDEAAVALAFAEFKIRAACSPAVGALARAALQRQRKQAIEATNWPHREERLKTLGMLEAKLPRGGG
jgi:uncharacterized protein YfeS